MTNRDILCEQIAKVVGITQARLCLIRDHLPETHEIIFSIVIDDHSDLTYEQKPDYEIKVSASITNGLFEDYSYSFPSESLPIINTYLKRHQRVFHEALSNYRLDKHLRIHKLQKRIARIEYRTQQVDKMLDFGLV